MLELALTASPSNAQLKLHCLQLHAVSTYHDGESAFVTFLEVVGGSGVLKT